VRFGINLIPHTGQHTTLGDLRVGHEVNIEIDLSPATRDGCSPAAQADVRRSWRDHTAV
jgi:riboflavin synthase alpha subunit